jgi:hypothetical protein
LRFSLETVTIKPSELSIHKNMCLILFLLTGENYSGGANHPILIFPVKGRNLN